jgi:PAS domain S-box-containing protein
MRLSILPNSVILRIPFIYFCVGVLWILLGNQVLDELTSDLSHDSQLQYGAAKGLAFVTLTTILIFVLVNQQQKKLVRSEKQYRALFAGNPHPMFIFNVITKRIVEVNQAAIHKYGYSKSEFEGLDVYDIRPAEGRQLLDDALKEYKRGHEYACTWKHMKKSGEVFGVSIVAHEINFNNQDCIMVHVIDIDKQLKNEQKLQEAFCVEKELNQALEINNKILEGAYKENRRLGEILDKINNLVIIVDKEGKISWVNKAFCSFTGYTKEEVTGKTPSLLVGPETDLKIIDELTTTVHCEEFFSEEIINYTKSQQPYWVQLNVSPLFDDSGRYEGTISVQSIINDRKESESRIQAQNRALREIAWISSHEFRRPVASIVSISAMLGDVADEEERQEYIRLLRVSSSELDEVSRDIACRINDVEKSCQP